MINRKKLLMSAVLTVSAITFTAPAIAGSTQSVTSKTSTVNPDGSVSYESQTVVTKEPGVPVIVAPTTTTTVVTTETAAPGDVIVTRSAGMAPVTFYYYEPKTSKIISAPDLSESIFDLWDNDNNDVIDMNEFYRNQMVMYEPVEYSKRTYQDIDADGVLELTQDEYSVRVQKLPLYSSLNKDNKPGISLYEFIGTGFQSADKDDNNNLSYRELHDAFYGQANLTAGTGHYNGSKNNQ